MSKRRRFGLDGSRRGRKHTQTRVAPFRPCLPRCATRSVHTPCQQQGDSGFSKRCSTSIVRSKQLAGLQTSKFAILLQVLDTGMNSSVNSNHPARLGLGGSSAAWSWMPQFGRAHSGSSTHRRNVCCSSRRPFADIDFEQRSFGGSTQAGTSTRNRLGCPAQSCYIQCSGTDSMCTSACVQEQRGVGPPRSRVHQRGNSGGDWGLDGDKEGPR